MDLGKYIKRCAFYFEFVRKTGIMKTKFYGRRIDKMISSFNLDKVKELFRDFYTLTRIRVTLFDERFEELSSYPEHLPEFCRLLRSDPVSAKQCRLCDKEACRSASTRHATYIYRCHAGLTEAISPVYFGNIVIGYLFFGHVFSYPDYETGWTEIRSRCRSCHVDEEALHAACLKRPIISEEYILAASHLLHAVASYLCMERMVTIRRQELPVRIDDYIMAHLDENLSACDICREFHIGKTFLYEIAHQSYGTGIAQHIRNLRVARAQSLLLEHPELRISEISSMCGFANYNYFITMFKRVTGVTPKAYRRQHLAAIPDTGSAPRSILS